MIVVRAFLPVLALLLTAALAGCHKAHDVDAIYDNVNGTIGDGDGDGDSGDGDGDATAGDGDATGGDGDTPTPNPDDFGDSCSPGQCPDPSPILAMFVGNVSACCTPDNLCGTMLMGACLENDAPGSPDPACPDDNSMGFPLSGCCKDDGICGVDLGMVGLGCALTGDPRSQPTCN